MNKTKEYRKIQILKWCSKNNRRPQKTSKNKTERKIATFLNNIITPTSVVFCSEFRKLIFKKFPPLKQRKTSSKRNPELRKTEVINFIKKNKRSPTRTNPDESRLACSLVNYTAPSSPFYDSKFDTVVKKLDKCSKTHIPYHYRKSINLILDNRYLKRE